jgi:hypothetical protein
MSSLYHAHGYLMHVFNGIIIIDASLDILLGITLDFG